MTALLKLLAAKQTVLDQLQSARAAARSLSRRRPRAPRVARRPPTRRLPGSRPTVRTRCWPKPCSWRSRREAAMLRRRDAAAAALAAVQAAADARTAYADSAAARPLPPTAVRGLSAMDEPTILKFPTPAPARPQPCAARRGRSSTCRRSWPPGTRRPTACSRRTKRCAAKSAACRTSWRPRTASWPARIAWPTWGRWPRTWPTRSATAWCR